MRLTLRTLLAYLDDILEPSQAREIGDKLNESSFASSLVSRIREVMRRRRLTAPTLSGPGVGIDPNTVAEYLDNTLPPDGVADVEKICLESDVHLAEAAACHQILTLALGEPVEIAPQTRERMYALGPSAAKMTVAAQTNGTGRSVSANGRSGEAFDDVLSQAEAMPQAPQHHPAAAVAAAPRHAAEIPEYLRQGSSFKRLLAYALVAAALIGWAILMVNDSLFKNPAGPAENSGDGQPVNVAVAGNRQKPEDPVAGDQTEPPAEPGDKVAVIGKPTDAGEKLTTQPKVPRRTVGIDKEPPPELEDDGVPTPKSKTALSGAKVAADAAPAVAAKSAEPTPQPDGDVAPPSAPLPAPSRYVSTDGVTLHYVPRDERWFMLPRRAQVYAGDQLAVPDPFQCSLEIEGGRGLVAIMPGSAVRVLEPTDAGTFGLEFRRGQLVVRAPTPADDKKESLRIAMAIAGELWGLEIPPGAACGVQVNPRGPTKFEQVLDKDAYIGAFYVSTGAAVVTDPVGKMIEIKGPGFLQLPLKAGADAEDKGPLVHELNPVPKWMVGQTLSTTAQNYARLFERMFNPDDAVELSVPEIVNDSRPEIARLATECLGLIEAYGPLVEVLHRSPHEEARRAAISGLRLWLPRKPENKELLKVELARRLPPEDADAVYKLLWGYDEEDARNKVISTQLIDWMSNPETSIRELAFYHVFRLTGKDLEYRPNAVPVKLRSSLKRWADHLKREGALLPPQKPIPNPQ